jgi:hypothetical protein
MGPKIDSLLYAILSSLLRNRFVLPLWIRQDRYLKRLKGTKVVQAILEQKMDVPGSFGAVCSDGEEGDSAGKEADNGEDLDEDDLTSIDDELDEQISDTLISSGDKDA